MEIQTARKWYRWLWFSPILTVPTLFLALEFVGSIAYSREGWGINFWFKIVPLIAVGISSLWHLILLIPANDKHHPFVKWHGRQALFLAGLRTAVPIIFILVLGDSILQSISILLLIPIWLFGTLWGQRQAARGDSSLMRWTGREDILPAPQEEIKGDAVGEISIEVLETTLRSSEDPQKRQAALEELEKRGLVENL
jgi:hypothetical protein